MLSIKVSSIQQNLEIEKKITYISTNPNHSEEGYSIVAETLVFFLFKFLLDRG